MRVPSHSCLLWEGRVSELCGSAVSRIEVDCVSFYAVVCIAAVGVGFVVVTKLSKDAVDWCLSDVLVPSLTEDLLLIGLIKACLNQIVGQSLWLVKLPVECRLHLGKCVAVHRRLGGPSER
jgi:hypothetical protein